MAPQAVRCYLVDRDSLGNVTSQLTAVDAGELTAGQVRIAVEYSSLNYKDLLAAQGHPGIVKHFPHVPGIDAAGEVVASTSAQYPVGSKVIVTGYELGQSHWGGWAESIQVPAEWLIPMPVGWSSREAMIMGTAGFTAVQCIEALQRNDVHPNDGEIVVTGATGGVGSLAVQLLVKLGYQVCAVTGKSDEHERLLSLGAARVLSREEVQQDDRRPMQSARWAGGVDTVGGNLLTHVLRQTQYSGAVAACGLVAGAELSMTLYPFLLRGVSLCGVASADCPYDRRVDIWHKLAGDWRLDVPETWVTEVTLDNLQECLDRMSDGRLLGRVIVRLTS